eukprot:TRINITY_DN3961_c1_g1_i1.p1 TRINITY_DN3961_c1_g1~~TRINITY_DN3961_c1_g1_i1.p1  ORF type:complete len:876 (-),score=95.99 TRINITY_DN3961_c1_g1_i1:384-3011(-)
MCRIALFLFMQAVLVQGFAPVCQQPVFSGQVFHGDAQVSLADGGSLGMQKSCIGMTNPFKLDGIELISNGNFERPIVVNSRGFDFYSTSELPVGWFTSDANRIELWKEGLLNSPERLSNGERSGQHLELGGDNRNPTVSTKFFTDFEASQVTATLSFEYWLRPGFPVSKFQVILSKLDGVRDQAIRAIAVEVPKSSDAWQKRTVSIVLDNKTLYSLKFQQEGQKDGGIHIDAVSVFVASESIRKGKELVANGDFDFPKVTSSNSFQFFSDSILETFEWDQMRTDTVSLEFCKQGFKNSPIRFGNGELTGQHLELSSNKPRSGVRTQFLTEFETRTAVAILSFQYWARPNFPVQRFGFRLFKDNGQAKGVRNVLVLERLLGTNNFDRWEEFTEAVTLENNRVYTIEFFETTEKDGGMHIDAVSVFVPLQTLQDQPCDNSLFQRLSLCEDGTLRDSGDGFCLTADESQQSTLQTNVLTKGCSFGLDKAQQWEVVPSTQLETGFTLIDGSPFSIKQDGFKLRNNATNQCLQKNQIGLYEVATCTQDQTSGVDNQVFYERSWKVEESGVLVSQEFPAKCLQQNGRSVDMQDCDGSTSQLWTLLDSRDLVNENTGHCLVTALSGKGPTFSLTSGTAVEPCQDMNNHKWLENNLTCRGDFCSFYTDLGDDFKCLRAVEAGSDLETIANSCRGQESPNARFQFKSEKFSAPVAEWVQVACNEGGSISLEVTETVSVSKGQFSEIVNSVGSAISEATTFGASFTIGIEGGIPLGPTLSAEASTNFEISTEVSLSQETSQALGREFSTTKEESQTVGVSCDVNEDGNTFVGGCLWQLRLSTSNLDNEVTWDARFTRCTSNPVPPKCPPFYECFGEDCEICRPIV